MPASNLTQSSPKTSWLGRWVDAWRRRYGGRGAPARQDRPTGEGARRSSRSGGESPGQRRATPPSSSPERYEFFGRHLLASYVDCDPAALADHSGLKAAMRAAVAAAGATLLDSAHYSFTPSGMTAVLLLAESHASIHTYPEHQACFVDLFTCGRACSAEKFDATLREYLRPVSVQRRTVLRHAEGIETSPAGAEDWLAEWAA